MFLIMLGSPSPGPPHLLTCAVQSAQTLLTLRHPFIPDYLPFHLTPGREAIKGSSNWCPSTTLQNFWFLREKSFLPQIFPDFPEIWCGRVKGPRRRHKVKTFTVSPPPSQQLYQTCLLSSGRSLNKQALRANCFLFYPLSCWVSLHLPTLLSTTLQTQRWVSEWVSECREQRVLQIWSRRGWGVWYK